MSVIASLRELIAACSLKSLDVPVPPGGVRALGLVGADALK